MKTLILSTILVSAIATPTWLSAASNSERGDCLKAARSAYKAEVVACADLEGQDAQKACVQAERAELKREKDLCPARAE